MSSQIQVAITDPHEWTGMSEDELRQAGLIA